MSNVVAGDQMTLSRWLIALSLVGLFYTPIIIAAVQICHSDIVGMPKSQPLPAPTTAPQVALEFAPGRDDVEHDLIKERFAEMMRVIREASRPPFEAPQTARTPHLQDQSKRFTVGVAAGPRPAR